ncbi:MAG: hypothetical protein OK441_00220 [Thaumarchaeota archaeon]|nr:hypothetical protein [Nitrososphaerota archaeon]
MIPLLSAYSAMTIQASGSSSTSGTSSSSPTTYSYSESYTTNYVSATTYKVTINFAEGSNNVVYIVWLLKDGTAVAVDVSGFNITGSSAQESLIGAFAGFELQLQADAEINAYTTTSFFHSTGTSTVSVGPTMVSVTNYAANSLPETVTSCTGSPTTLTAFSFSVGTPQGTSAPLVTNENISGSDVISGQTTTFNYVLQVTSITIA